jgi:hypothetical protein
MARLVFNFLKAEFNYTIIFYKSVCRKSYTTYIQEWHVFLDMWETHVIFNNMGFSHAFLIALIRKHVFITCLKDTSFLYVDWEKFLQTGL